MSSLVALDKEKVLCLCSDVVQTPFLHQLVLGPFGVLGLHCSALEHLPRAPLGLQLPQQCSL